MRHEAEADDIAFVKEAFDSLRTPRLLLPALLLAALLAADKIAILSVLPTTQNPDHLPYLIAFMLMTLAVIAFVVAILRILNHSFRSPWQPDSSLWLYGLAFIASSFLALSADFVVGGRNDHLSGLAAAALDTAVRAPFAPWLVAIAVERSLAWRPLPWLSGFSTWLPSFLLWGFLILVPLRQLQLMVNWHYLVAGTDWYWPAALLDGALGTVIELIALALASTAYRRVARS
ncbi:MAG TPA: hypothetical protein VK472_04265 [Allosphingosinicella sp.]|nr:hypothetical protein [Allosphingosinicella sp.]